MPNGPPEEEAGSLVDGRRCERTAGREAYRAGHCERGLATKSGEVTIRIPRLKGVRFTTAIIERYRRREASDEKATKTVREGCVETLAYTRVPAAHWRRIRTDSAIERLNRKIRSRTRVVGTFQDGTSALILVTARLKYIAESE